MQQEPQDDHRIRRGDRHECNMRRKNLPAYQKYVWHLARVYTDVDTHSAEMKDILQNVVKKVV